MINKINFSYSLIFIFLIPLFPIVQYQWLNIFLLNKFEFSFYTILYFLSGFLFPILVLNNSLNTLYEYKYNLNKYQIKKIKFTSYLIFFTVLILSILIFKYFIFSLMYICPQLDLNIYFNNKYKLLILLLLMIFLLINKTKRIIKKLFLLNFFIICFINWTNYFINLLGIDIAITKYISNDVLYEFKNLNILNILYLLTLEIFFYIWSFITYKNNISDWSIPYPKKNELINISKIVIFYLGVLIYYYIFNIII